MQWISMHNALGAGSPFDSTTSIKISCQTTLSIHLHYNRGYPLIYYQRHVTDEPKPSMIAHCTLPCIQIDNTCGWQSRRRPALTSPSNMIKRSSSRRSSRQRTRARYMYTLIYVANHPTRTRGLGDSGNDVLLAARLSCCSLLLKSTGWHTAFACKKTSSKKKPTARP